VITDDDVIRVLEQANPASVDDPISMPAAAGYLDSLRSTTVPVVELDPTPTAPISGRRWPILITAAAVVLVVVGALVVAGGRDAGESQPAAAPPVANGLIAFVGESDDYPATSDIYVVAADGTGLRRLTSTPELVEYAPAWSPDGSRLAFVRTDDYEFTLRRPPCATGCELVVVDPSTGVETFAVDIPQLDVGETWVAPSLTWSPDGHAIVIPLHPCGSGGCGPPRTVIADLETAAFTTFATGGHATWSPDGEWLSLGGGARGPSTLLVPADLIEAGDVVDPTQLLGVSALPTDDFDGETVEWMPDSSAIVVPSGVAPDSRIDVVTVADGERRTLLEDGLNPAVSPDGTQIAYVRDDRPALKEIWVAAADGTDPHQVTLSLTAPAWSPDGSLLLASDHQGFFTVRPDGTDRTELDIRDHTPFFALPGFITSGIDWQPDGAHQQ
jgi:Tol biopolymer transport system component